ncbi:MAG: ATP-binding protein [Porcipelethomonas sp.]
MISLLRMEIACFIILFFIGCFYFSARREKTLLHKIFSAILIVLMIHLVFDAVTVYTVNHLYEIPRWLNDTLHRIFLMTMLLLVYLYYQYISCLIMEEMRDRDVGMFQTFIQKLYTVYLAVAEILLLVSPVTYEETPKGNYAAGSAMIIMVLSIGLFLVHMMVSMMVNWKVVHPKKRYTILLALAIEIVVTLLTLVDTSLLLAGMGLTLIAIAFYLVLENPDIKLLEEARAAKEKSDMANASKSRLVSTVSHEIRTPMNAVVGMTDLLLQDDLTEKQRKYLTNIKSSGRALVMIVNDILDSSKIEAGKMELVEKAYTLGIILEDVRMIIENRIGSKLIKLVYDIDSSIPERLTGDELRIRQVLINLMNNSVKFTEEGEIKLTISIVSETDDGYMLRFSVKDTGQGIKPEDLDRLFEAFSQVDVKKNHGKEGTGLGLSISSDLITLMGGQLEVASEYGKWSEFFFTVFQRKADDQPEEEENIPDADFEGMNVLVVDDTELNLEIAREILGMFGVKADTASSGREGLELLAENRYDMIFTDYVMPEMSGAEFTRKIRAIEGEYFSAVPVIALTGDTSSEAREEFRKSGINDFIEKPVGADSLKKVLEKWNEVIQK